MTCNFERRLHSLGYGDTVKGYDTLTKTKEVDDPPVAGI